MLRINFEKENDLRTLNNIELLGILTKGTKAANTLSECSTVIESGSEFERALSLMTPAKKEIALAAVELYKRSQALKEDRQQIRNSEHIYKLLYPYMADLKVEECWIICLNQAAKVIKVDRVSAGGLASTQVDIRVILKKALLCDATSIILSHNHPSGNIHPSGDDDRLTSSLFNAAKAMKIRLLDHVIITNGAYYSYADEGRI